MATLQPHETKPSAMPRPIPPLPPVISETLPDKSNNFFFTLVTFSLLMLMHIN